MKIFETVTGGEEAAKPGLPKEQRAVPYPGKAAGKPEIVDQIGLHLRSVYDDILSQPVPGRFLELLKQLESSSDVRPRKDGM